MPNRNWVRNSSAKTCPNRTFYRRQATNSHRSRSKWTCQTSSFCSNIWVCSKTIVRSSNLRLTSNNNSHSTCFRTSIKWWCPLLAKACNSNLSTSSQWCSSNNWHLSSPASSLPQGKDLSICCTSLWLISKVPGDLLLMQVQLVRLQSWITRRKAIINRVQRLKAVKINLGSRLDYNSKSLSNHQ